MPKKANEQESTAIIQLLIFRSTENTGKLEIVMLRSSCSFRSLLLMRSVELLEFTGQNGAYVASIAFWRDIEETEFSQDPFLMMMLEFALYVWKQECVYEWVIC